MVAANHRMTMDPNITPSSLTTLIGSACAAILAGALMLRKFLSKDAVARAGDTAEKDIIDILRSQLTIERDRNDKLLASLDAANTATGQLRAQVADLGDQVRRLQSQISSLQAKS